MKTEYFLSETNLNSGVGSGVSNSPKNINSKNENDGDDFKCLENNFHKVNEIDLPSNNNDRYDKSSLNSPFNNLSEIKFSSKGYYLVLLNDDRKELQFKKLGEDNSSNINQSHNFDNMISFFQVIDIDENKYYIIYLASDNIFYYKNDENEIKTISSNRMEKEMNKNIVKGTNKKFFIDAKFIKILEKHELYLLEYNDEIQSSQNENKFIKEPIDIDFSPADKLWVRGTYYFMIKKFKRASEFFQNAYNKSPKKKYKKSLELAESKKNENNSQDLSGNNFNNDPQEDKGLLDSSMKDYSRQDAQLSSYSHSNKRDLDEESYHAENKTFSINNSVQVENRSQNNLNHLD